MAGEIEPTYGEVVKSSANLRIAFLRQEFVEGLVLENTLKEELVASFVEERKILADIEACEKELEATTDNPEKMDEVLQRLSQLQDKATAKGAYSLEPKVEKVMDQIGFSKDDATALVSSFSGGWKMRIGLAKILLSDPYVPAAIATAVAFAIAIIAAAVANPVVSTAIAAIAAAVIYTAAFVYCRYYYQYCCCF